VSIGLRAGNMDLQKTTKNLNSQIPNCIINRTKAELKTKLNLNYTILH